MSDFKTIERFAEAMKAAKEADEKSAAPVAERPTPEQIEEIKAALAACLDGGRGFQWGPCHPEGGFASPEDVIEYMGGAVRRSAEATPGRALELWAVHVSKGGESPFVCHTGNGPTSEAHARFIAPAPFAVSTLLAEVDALREEMRNLDVVEAHNAELRKNALPSNCTRCNGNGAEPPGCPESGPCERCGGWTTHKRLVAGAEAAAIARAVAAEQRAETAELALAELRRRAWLHLEFAGGTGHVSRDGLRTALRDEPTGLAEALRRELRAEGMEEARALVNAELQTEAVSRDRAYAAGRTEVGSHRQACVEALESATHRIDTRAAELRGPK